MQPYRTQSVHSGKSLRINPYRKRSFFQARRHETQKVKTQQDDQYTEERQYPIDRSKRDDEQRKEQNTRNAGQAFPVRDHELFPVIWALH